jgi:uncharacterized phiE125 gp8 family phage protein
VDADDTTQDAILLAMISAARKECEEKTGLCFARRTFRLTLDQFPSGNTPIELPWAPLVSVQSLTYTDAAGDQQVLSGSPESWLLDTDAKPGRISPIANGSWPSTQNIMRAVIIDYTAGWNLRDDMPQEALLWMQARIATMEMFREQAFVGNVSVAPFEFVDGILARIRIRSGFA